MEVLGCQQIKSPGNVMNCPEKKNRWEGVEVLGGQKIKRPGNVMNCRENRYIFLTPLRGWREGGADGREGTAREKGRGRQAGKEGPERKLYLVSKPDIFLEQTKTNALEGFIGTIAVGWRGNN